MFLSLTFALLPLLDDRPPVEDLHRFPPCCVVEQQLSANRLYREHLESRLLMELHQYWIIQAALVETRQLYEAWDTLRWAHRYGTPAYQRDMLKHLRDLLGPEDYYAGHMPPPLPLHRLVRRD